MAELSVSDVMSELRDENERLAKQLSFANKCLQLLHKYRNYLAVHSVRCVCETNADSKSLYYDLEDEYRRVADEIDDQIGERKVHGDSDDGVHVISFDNNRTRDKTKSAERRADNERDSADEDIIDDNSEDSSRAVSAVSTCESSKKIQFKRINDSLHSKASTTQRTFRITHNYSVSPPKVALVVNEDNVGDNRFGDYYSNILDNLLLPEVEFKVCDEPSKRRTPASTPSKPIYCYNPKCYKTLGRNKNEPMRHHLKTEKCVEEKPFGCDWPECGMKFKSQYYLSRHALTHQSDKPFTCDFAGCAAVFKSLESVARHRKTHTQEKRFECGFCGKRFARNCHRKEHEECVHFGYKMFACDRCDETFKRNAQLNKHKLTHH